MCEALGSPWRSLGSKEKTAKRENKTRQKTHEDDFPTMLVGMEDRSADRKPDKSWITDQSETNQRQSGQPQARKEQDYQAEKIQQTRHNGPKAHWRNLTHCEFTSPGTGCPRTSGPHPGPSSCR